MQTISPEAHGAKPVAWVGSGQFCIDPATGLPDPKQPATDSQPAIQAAIAALPPGGVLDLSKSYRINAPIVVDKEITIQGSGGRRSRFGIWQYTARTPALILAANGIRALDVVVWDRVANTGDVLHPTAHGIVIKRLAFLERCHAQWFAGNGIHAYGSLGNASDPTELSGTVIRECSAAECRGHGLYVGGADANSLSIENFDARDCYGFGIFDASFLGNRITGMLHTNKGWMTFEGADLATATAQAVAFFQKSTAADLSIVQLTPTAPIQIRARRTAKGGGCYLVGGGGNQQSAALIYQEEDQVSYVAGLSRLETRGGIYGSMAIQPKGGGQQITGWQRFLAKASGVLGLQPYVQVGSLQADRVLEFGRTNTELYPLALHAGHQSYGVWQKVWTLGRLITSQGVVQFSDDQGPDGPERLYRPSGRWAVGSAGDPQRFFLHHGSSHTPPPKQVGTTYRPGDRYEVLRPVAGGWSSYRLVAITAPVAPEVNGTLVWRGEWKLEP